MRSRSAKPVCRAMTSIGWRLCSIIRRAASIRLPASDYESRGTPHSYPTEWPSLEVRAIRRTAACGHPEQLCPKCSEAGLLCPECRPHHNRGAVQPGASPRRQGNPRRQQRCQPRSTSTASAAPSTWTATRRSFGCCATCSECRVQNWAAEWRSHPKCQQVRALTHR